MKNGFNISYKNELYYVGVEEYSFIIFLDDLIGFINISKEDFINKIESYNGYVEYIDIGDIGVNVLLNFDASYKCVKFKSRDDGQRLIKDFLEPLLILNKLSNNK